MHDGAVAVGERESTSLHPFYGRVSEKETGSGCWTHHHLTHTKQRTVIQAGQNSISTLGLSVGSTRGCAHTDGNKRKDARLPRLRSGQVQAEAAATKAGRARDAVPLRRVNQRTRAQARVPVPQKQRAHLSQTTRQMGHPERQESRAEAGPLHGSRASPITTHHSPITASGGRRRRERSVPGGRLATRGSARRFPTFGVRRSLFPSGGEALRGGLRRSRRVLTLVLVSRDYRIPYWCSSIKLQNVAGEWTAQMAGVASSGIARDAKRRVPPMGRERPSPFPLVNCTAEMGDSRKVIRGEGSTLTRQRVGRPSGITPTKMRENSEGRSLAVTRVLC
jgi:hypothetical protein